MTDCSAIKARLDDAIAARDRLVQGAQVAVIVDAFRSRVEYTQSSIPALTAEIQRLQAEYNVCIAPSPSQVQAMTKPIRFYF